MAISPGYGRGGRGAALLAALQQPIRRPGSNTTSPQSSISTNGESTSLGRGAELRARLEQNGDARSTDSEEKKPLGRGARLLVSLAALGALPTNLCSQAKADLKSLNDEASPRNVEENGDDADRRFSKYECMMEKINANDEAVKRIGQAGERILLSCNFIPVRCENEGFHQYSVSFNPAVDSRRMREKMIEAHSNTLGKVTAFDGAILFLPFKLDEKETRLASPRPSDGTQTTIVVKYVKVVQPNKATVIYNNIFRRMKNKLDLCQIGRNNYDPKGKISVPRYRLEVWPGYITAAAEYEGGLMMICDVSHRVLRYETALDVIAQIIQRTGERYREHCYEELLRSTVLTRYNNKTYRIDDIAWDKSPRDTFSHHGQEISFIEYYKKQYKKEIKDPDQPLLIHRPRKKDPNEEDRLICLIPELCYMTGLTNDMRSDNKLMKDVASHTRIDPATRRRSIRKFCELVNSTPEAKKELDNWKLTLDIDLLQINGRQLAPEEILFGRGRCSAGEKGEWGLATGKQNVITAADLKHWLIVYPGRERMVAQDLLRLLPAVSADVGIEVLEPKHKILQNDRTESYIQAIRSSIIPDWTQCVVAIFLRRCDDRYNAFKKLCCIECPVPSQAILAGTLKNRNLRSIVQKIALQINCKLGGELWALNIPPKKLMVCGIDVYHDPGQKNASVAGFVASVNPEITRWYSRTAKQMPGQEIVDALRFSLLDSILEYRKNNGHLPDRIVIYRDGVGEGQLPHVADYETKQLEECFCSFGDGYRPKLAVVVVCKRVNTRLFAIKGNLVNNPGPGTIADHAITSRKWYDFYLISQHVNQGTVTPTHYYVLNDNFGWSPDQMQRLAYKMTHLYYNWPGTVRVPAPCQYAHKLAYLVGQNLRKEASEKLANRLFYL